MRIKKLIACSMIAVMTVGVIGCGKKSSEKTDTTEAVTEAEEEEEPEVEEADDEMEAELPIESSLKGTGAATPESLASNTDAEDGGGLQIGDTLVDINFDDGDIDGFFEYMQGGEYALAAEDGKLVAKIKSCGKLDYANQAYWDGFSLSKGAVYTYSFDISSDIERKIEYRLQLNGGDYHAYQGEYIDIGPEVRNFSVDFEMTEDSDPAPRIVFNMGMMEDMTEDPGEHNVYIDNIMLVVKDASNAQVVQKLPRYVNVAVDQVGYKADDEKIAIVKSGRSDEEEFIVCDAETDETVYAGKLTEYVYDLGSGCYTKQANFSELNIPGRYYVFTEEGSSFEFSIEDDPYTDIYKDAVLMLYKQRCGVETDRSIVGDFAHGKCHTGEAVVYDDKSKKKDVSGGWHDAGDYGRYVVSGAQAVADLMEAYEDYQLTADDIGIPESGNEIPDILDEARFELDWMLKMQDEETGGVYHKVTCLNFPETVGPEEEKDTLYLAPISTAATGDFAAVMAKASVLYKDYDLEFSTAAYQAALQAWDYIKDIEDDKGYTNPEDIVTGEYPDANTLDEKYWAAAELYLAGDSELLDTVKKLSAADGVDRGLGWAAMATYADYDLAKSGDVEVADIGVEQISAQADELLDKMAEDSYFMALGKDYPWGSNMNVANNGQLLSMAANITADDNYSNIAKKQLDYLLGANSMGYCFVTGYGVFSPKNPHHRPSQVIGEATPGMLVGGPASRLEDPYAQAVLSGQKAAMCYVDNVQSYSTNEVAVYWNSPLIYLLAAEQ